MTSIVRLLRDKWTDVSIFGKLCCGVLTVPPTWWLWQRRDKVKERYQARKAVTEKVFMDIAIGDRYAGRVLIGLYGNDVPLTVENFVQLCKGFKVQDKIIGYRNTMFHRVIPGICLMGGDTQMGNGQSMGMSIYGPQFPDENFNMRFIQDGDLAMLNSGPNTNASQFMITLAPAPILHGKHVVFGTVVKGMRVIRECGDQGTRSGRALLPIRILHAGTFNEEDPPPVPQGLTKAAQPKVSEEDFFDLREGKTKGHGTAGVGVSGISAPIM